MKTLKVYFAGLLTLVAVLFVPNMIKAATMVDEGMSDYITISNITYSSADVDWSGIISRLQDLYGVEDVRNFTFKVVVGDTIIAENTTATSASVYNLNANTRYFVDVYPTHEYVSGYDEDGNAIWETDTGFDFETFTTGENLNSSWSDIDSSNSTSTVTPPSQSADTSVVAPGVDTSIVTPGTYQTITLQKPSISKVVTTGDTVEVLASNVDTYTTSYLEWQLFDAKTKKSISKTTSYNTYNAIYGVKSRKTYFIKCRAVTYDSDYNYVYSEWSSPKYFIAQPKITTTNKDIKKNQIKIKWKKVQGAKSYTVYAKKGNSKKYTKIKTTTKTSYTLKNIKGKTLNTLKSKYYFYVVANGKVDKKTIKSSNSEQYYANSYWVYK